MTEISNEFEQYGITYSTGLAFPRIPRISCVNRGSIRGIIYFVRDDIQIPPPDATRVIRLYYPLSQFSDVINILRYEKPLYIFIDTDTGEGGVRTIPTEPIGEQES